MTTNSEIDSNPTPASWIQISFYAVTIVFNLCLIAQLLTVGIAYFNDSSWWNIHVWLVRSYGGLSFILWVWSAVASFPSKIRHLAAALPILLGLQFATIHLTTPLHLEIFHPLIGFSLFYTSSSLVHRTSRLLFNVSSG